MVTVTISCPVRTPYKENGKTKFSIVYHDGEYAMEKKYTKILKPLSNGSYDCVAREENGTITVTFTPIPPGEIKVIDMTVPRNKRKKPEPQPKHSQEAKNAAGQPSAG